MAERVVDRVREWMEGGRTRLEAFQQLREQGYGETVAERIVEEASAAGTGFDTRKLLAITAVILLVIGGGAAFAVLTILPADGGDRGNGDGSTPTSTAPPNLSTIIDRTGRATYHVTYTVSRPNVTAGLNITAVTAYRDGGEARKDVDIVTDGATQRITAYDPVATSQLILCGDLTGSETCTTDHPYLFITALALTDLRTFHDSLATIPATYDGNTTVQGRTCDRFTLDATTDTLYAAVSGQVTGSPARTEPVTVTACADRQLGYIADLTIRDANTSDGAVFSMTAATINTTLPADTFIPPRPVSLAAECAVNNATATLLALHPNTTEATLTVAGSNRTVPLPQRYRPVHLPLGDLPSGTTTLTAYADGRSVSTPCTPLS